MQCRALELDELMKSVSEPVSGGCRSVMQLLPRHMRRRAANHDVRRLPLKRRLEAQNDVCAAFCFVPRLPLAVGSIMFWVVHPCVLPEKVCL